MMTVVTRWPRSIGIAAVAILTACANGDAGTSDARDTGEPRAAAEAVPVADAGTSASVDNVESSSTASTADASSSPVVDPGARAAGGSVSCSCASGTMMDILRAALRERFPTITSMRVAEMRSQRWGQKHLVVTMSQAPDSLAGYGIIGVHVFDSEFTLLRTLDVFKSGNEAWPSIHRVAADSVVVQMNPEKGEPTPSDRKAYDWRSIEE